METIAKESHEELDGTTRSKISSHTRGSPNPVDKDRRIVLLGMTGSGKSSSCNTIVGSKKAFNESPSASSETFRCEFVSREAQRRNVRVVDTPGIFDTRRNNDETLKEITRCVALTAPGPHALILVIAAGNRVTKWTQKSAEMILSIFGKHAYRHMIILFTQLDNLLYHDVTIDAFVETLSPEMKDVIRSCNNRYIAFNNREQDPKAKVEQVNKLLELVDKVVDKNDGCCFTNKVFEAVEKCIAARQMKLEKEYEEEQLVQKSKQPKCDQTELNLNEERDKELKKIKEELRKEIQNDNNRWREIILKEIQNDKEGSGSFFKELLDIVSRAIGYIVSGIKIVGATAISIGILGIDGIKSLSGNMWSYIFGD